MAKAALVLTLLLLTGFLPASATQASSLPFTVKPESGGIGTLVHVSGNLSWMSTPIEIVFQYTTVNATKTDASGHFSTTFFVPAVATGIYTVSVTNGSVYYQFHQNFTVKFGTNSIVGYLQDLNATILKINGSLNALSAKDVPLQSTIEKLQSDLFALSKNVTNIVNGINGITLGASNAQASGFADVNQEIRSINNSISNVNNDVASIRSNQNQLLLYLITTTVAVGAVLLVAIRLGTRGRRRSGTNDWSVLD